MYIKVLGLIKGFIRQAIQIKKKIPSLNGSAWFPGTGERWCGEAQEISEKDVVDG